LAKSALLVKEQKVSRALFECKFKWGFNIKQGFSNSSNFVIGVQWTPFKEWNTH